MYISRKMRYPILIPLTFGFVKGNRPLLVFFLSATWFGLLASSSFAEEEEVVTRVEKSEMVLERDASEAEVESQKEDEAPEGEEEIVSKEEEVVEEVIPGPSWAKPAEAMVAVRGSATANLGILSMHRQQPVVWTTLSALDNNVVLQVTTPDGTEVPIRAIFGSGNRDLAFLVVGEGAEGLPFARPPQKDDSLRKGGNVRILGPQDSASQSVDGSGDSRRYPLPETDEHIFNGSPVVDSSGNWVGIYSPARKQPRIAGSRTGRDANIWPPGIVQGEGDLDWQMLELRNFFEERQVLDKIHYEIGQLQALFSRSSGELESQPLIAARQRLARRLNSSQTDTEKEQARRSFVFAVRGVASGIETEIDRGIETFSNYYIPELLFYQENFSNLNRQVRQLADNPSRADSLAR